MSEEQVHDEDNAAPCRGSRPRNSGGWSGSRCLELQSLLSLLHPATSLSDPGDGRKQLLPPSVRPFADHSHVVPVVMLEHNPPGRHKDKDKQKIGAGKKQLRYEILSLTLLRKTVTPADRITLTLPVHDHALPTVINTWSRQ